ncbi:MAG TPA: hypothetical protein VFE47_22795 [Tepidisphaeraceae bacterium]|jgi:hypothetical protein|nr:hypothetical protein [Tepidisphaeraceae bacterium]
MPDNPQAKSAFDAATRGLYHAFAKCRGQANWSDCLDVLTPERQSRPARLPAKELSDEDVSYFFSHSGYSMQHSDLVNGVKYFLPRVLASYLSEESCCKPSMVADAWFLGERLRQSEWLSWPNEQVEAVRSWFAAWLDAIVAFQPSLGAGSSSMWELPGNRSIHSWLEFAGKLDFDTASLVEKVEAGENRLAVNLVEACLQEFGKTLLRKHVLWEASSPAHQQPLLEWLLRYKTEKRLEEAFFECKGPPSERFVSKLLESLRAHKAALPSFG